ncbi:MAG TPA: hypothetical protein VGM77_10070 [Gemmatimonadales bacterium]|jgi:hypothetical protein
MRTRSRLTTAVAALCTLALPLAGQATHPDFTGTWVLDATKSVADGPMAAPTSGTVVIAMHGDSITMDQHSVSDMGETNSKKLYATDGYQWKNTLDYQGTPLALSSMASWKDKVLNIQTTTDFQGTPVDQAERWTLSADGKTLTQVIDTGSNGQSYGSMTMVFNKK